MWRQTIGLIIALGLLMVPIPLAAQQSGKIARIGFLGNSTPALEAHLVGPFRGTRSQGGDPWQTQVRALGVPRPASLFLWT
jgi:hypothetical protein